MQSSSNLESGNTRNKLECVMEDVDGCDCRTHDLGLALVLQMLSRRRDEADKASVCTKR